MLGIFKKKKKKEVCEQTDKSFENCIMDTIEKTGWNREYAIEQIETTVQQLGISYYEYIVNNFCRVSPENRLKVYDKILEKEKKKLRNQQQNESKDIEKENKANSTVLQIEKKSKAEQPYGTKISRVSKEGIEFYWKKPEYASGYDVFRANEENGKYEMIAHIEKRNIGVYTDSSFDHEKKEIYYRVRSFFDDVDGNRYFSEMTAPTKAVYRDIFELDLQNIYMYSKTEKQIHALYGWGEVEDAMWSSSDENIAVVDTNGIIKSISKGSCIIKCRSEMLNKESCANVFVDREPCDSISDIVSRFELNPITGIWENKGSIENGQCVIMMVGDMMCGSRQMRKQYSEPQGWNFNDSFRYVKKTLSESDFAIGNLETLIASPWPYMIDEAWIDYKNNCNAPSRYLDAVRYGGFDAVSLANNHNCDGGKRALIDTIEQVNKYKLANTGAFTNKQDKHYFIVNINGIKVGFISYMTLETTFNGKDENWTQEEKDTHLNVFSLEKAKRDIRDCKAEGAEYIIAYMHWGSKNYRNCTQSQIKYAQEVADAGADYIVGANPHVVQSYDEITSADGRKVPCFYSIGNFQAVMNQIPGNRESVIIRIKIVRTEDKKIVLKDNNYIPCYCYTNCEGCCWATVPLSEKYNNSIKKGRKYYKNVVNAVGDKIESIK